MSAAPQSAGILAFRRTLSGLDVLLVHPGGPWWARRDLGIWSIPKGKRGGDREIQRVPRGIF